MNADGSDFSDSAELTHAARHRDVDARSARVADRFDAESRERVDECFEQKRDVGLDEQMSAP